jgi:protein TonB
MRTLLFFFLCGCGALPASAQVFAPSTGPDTLVNGAFIKVDVEADYKGGLNGWIGYLTKNLNGDSAGRDVVIPSGKKELRLTAMVQFIVGKDGMITEARVLNKVPPSVEKEALRVILNSGQWIPAQQNARAVKAYRNQPITFVFTR